MKLVIKNMVCPRCVASVEQILSQLDIPFQSVSMGEVVVSKSLTRDELSMLSERLENVGFEILDEPRSKLIEKIKTLLIQKVQQEDIEPHFSLNAFLSSGMFREYSSLSKLFPEVEGITIEQFFILQKIEKAKELLFYNELSLAEIAWKLGYSSPQHLSSQFKRITGMTPGRFKKIGPSHRKPLDQIHIQKKS